MNTHKFGYSLILFSTLATSAVAMANSVLGQWQCEMTYQGQVAGAVQLGFDSNGSCQMAGQQYSYKLLPDNILQISDGTMTDSYSYMFKGEVLTLSYRDGSVFDCNKQQQAGSAGGMMSPQAMAGKQSAGNEWQVNGTFCHYSGSSSYDSSYSTTSRITFDGRGRWVMGSESSFSSNAGSAYSGGGADNGGSYRVSGGQIVYTTNSGEQGVARVNMQQRDGRITEIYVGEDLYSPSLCD